MTPLRIPIERTCPGKPLISIVERPLSGALLSLSQRPLWVDLSLSPHEPECQHLACISRWGQRGAASAIDRTRLNGFAIARSRCKSITYSIATEKLPQSGWIGYGIASLPSMAFPEACPADETRIHVRDDRAFRSTHLPTRHRAVLGWVARILAPIRPWFVYPSVVRVA